MKTTIALDVPPKPHDEMNALRNLWSAVLQRGLADAKDAVTHLAETPDDPTDRYIDRLRARRWLFSPVATVGSLNWICSVLDLDVRRVRSTVTA